MKKVLLIIMIMMISVLTLTACGESGETPKIDAATEVTATEQTTTELDTAEKQESEGTIAEVETTESNTAALLSDFIYEGEYLAYEYNEPELKIYANGDGTYLLSVGIIRLASFEDDDAVATAAGLEFTADDDSGNPIKGIITLEGNDAVVTFTESTWSLIPSGTVYRYYRPEG